MEGADIDTSRRYAAFLSYSRRDAATAARLHRELEAYQLPSGIDGPRRLKPVFRDMEELAAAPDLPAALREALNDSDALIVLCSPAAAASSWVTLEIDAFLATDVRRPVIPVLVEGEPAEAFPAALLRDGRSPLAADLRATADRRRGVQQIIAALLGVPLDTLARREAKRRRRRLAVSGGLAAVLALAIGGAAYESWTTQRAEALQREKSIALIGALQTDVRRKLKEAGRLDLLQEVNREALDYFAGAGALDDDALEQRALTLHAAGEDDQTRGDLKAARAKFVEAKQTTAALLSRRPDDAGRIFAHAQSEFWLAYSDWLLGNAAAAEAGFFRYAALADRLVAIDPKKPEWRLEQGYAASNIGIVQLRRHGEADQAARSFKAAISYFEDAQKRLTDSSPARREVANNWAWLADAEKLRGNYAAALADREHEAQLIAAMLRDNPRDMLALDVNSRNHVAVARIKLAQGQAAEALELLEKAHQEQAVLVATDPSNALNNAQLRMIELFQVRSKLSLPIALRPSSQALRASLGSCSTMPHELEVTVMCEILDARILAATDRETAAKRLADMARRYWPPGSNRLSATWGLDYEAEAALALKI